MLRRLCLSLPNPLNTLFPPLCPVCRDIVDKDGLCFACWGKIDFIASPYCLTCGDPFTFPGQTGHCWKCQKTPPLFDRHRSAFLYGPISKKLIFTLKHGRNRHVVPLLGRLLMPLALELPVDVIIPVPLHWKRLAIRCFNQSALLAQYIANGLNIPLQLNSLKRHKKTPSQGQFTLKARSLNVRDAFHIKNPTFFEGARILLIDDVYTTGSTLNACAKTLRKAGAEKIYALTLAKTPLNHRITIG